MSPHEFRKAMRNDFIRFAVIAGSLSLVTFLSLCVWAVWVTWNVSHGT